MISPDTPVYQLAVTAPAAVAPCVPADPVILFLWEHAADRAGNPNLRGGEDGRQGLPRIDRCIKP
ncbi:hypothetical protein [Sphingomonas prati]|uniref:Uncharacterized protein n=1 Tax=Sphingomonas prati TaxID=1843237 RepID=A0A7W9BRB8_9SPHN|nr:hypothetical protein [Sphingomonas prati]MBB5728652.1 hypothetical protein [Sphingomonas prati]GGE72130.1 hypothetical protein GCM10011404_00750 [Sphingomonas prati]